MAKNKIEIDVTTSDKGTTKKVAMEQKKAADAIDRTGKSAAQTSEQYRRTQGAAQNSANGTKNFAKAARGIEGIVPIYATFAANVFAISAAFNILQRNAALQKLEESLNVIGETAGRNLPRLAKSLREITGNAISTESALRTTAVAVTSGFSSSQLEGLTRVAKGASLALGRDLTDALDRLTRGTAKLEPEILDELGIIVRLDKAAADYAQTLKKSVSDLSQYEKQQAFLNATLEQGLDKYGDLDKEIAANPFDRLSSSAADLKESFIRTFSGPLAAAIEFVTTNIFTLTGAFGLLASGIIKQVTPAIQDLVSAQADLAKRFEEKAGDALSEAGKKVLAVTKDIPQAAELGISKTTQLFQVVDKVNNGVAVGAEELKRALQGTGSIQKKLANDLKAAKAKGDKEEAKRLKKQIKLIQNVIDKTRELKSLGGTGALETKSIASIGAGVAAEQANSLSKSFQEIGDAQGPIDLIAASFGGIRKQFGAIKPAFADFNDQLSKGTSRLVKFRGSFAAIKATGVATFTALANSAKIFGVALLNAIPVIGQIIFILGLLIEPIKSIGVSLGLLPNKFQEAGKEAEKALDFLPSAIGRLEKSLMKTDDAGEAYFRTIKFISGANQELISSLESLQKANDEAFGESAAELSDFRKETENLKRFGEGGFFELIKDLFTPWRFFPKFIDLVTVSLGNLGIIWRGLLSGNFSFAEQAEAEQKRIDDLRENAEKATKQSIVGRQIKEFEALGGASNTFIQEYIDKLREINVDTLSTDELKERLKEIDQGYANAAASVLNTSNSLSDFAKRQQDFTKAAKTFADPFIEGADAIRVNLLGAFNKDTLNTITIKDAKKEFEGLADFIKTIGAEGIDENESFNAKLLPAIQKYIDGLKAGNIALEQSKAKLAALVLKQKELAGLQRAAPEFTKKVLEAGDAVLQQKIAQKEEQLRLTDAISEQANVVRLNEELATLEAEKRIRERGRSLELSKAELAVQKRNLELSSKILQDQLAINKSKEALLKTELQIQNRQARNQDIFSGVGNRKARTEKAREVKLEEKLLRDRLATVGEELKLKKEGIRLEYDLLRVQAEFAATQSGNDEKILSSLTRYIGLLNRAESNALRAADAAVGASVATQVETVESKKQELKELTDFLDETVRASAQTFAESLQTGLVNLIRGKGSFKDALLGVVNSVLDTLAQRSIEELVQKAIDKFSPGDEQTEAEKASAVIETAGTTVASNIKDAINPEQNNIADKLKTAMEEGGNTLKAKISEACSGCVCPDSPGRPMENAISSTTTGTAPSVLSASSPPGPMEEVKVVGLNLSQFRDDPTYVEENKTPPTGTDDTNIAMESLNETLRENGGLTDKNSKFLSESTLALTDNIAEVGLLVGTLFKNTSVGEKLQKVMLALKIATIALKIAIMIQTAMDKAEEAGGFLKALFSQGANGGIAMGGITPYKNGGIVTAPKIGLVGEGRYNEAIVPLPNGRAIPVDMKGSGNQNNSVTVNVSIDQSGGTTQSSQSTGEDAKTLGSRVSAIVLQELQNQKRAGGMLSPY